ncbi:hypothetical protein IW261DRAFT_1428053 [Armillaria novae-zelandiae]|uniref:Uncharacterized protein n=1 Tax=Armillaria novae-zelandiae TaxID=153914 RepID=A0AA39NBU2_9AGAR|nr:hypothetical protein IW261DRAFT_1428053 [Armillaria novae-zelandiae]
MCYFYLRGSLPHLDRYFGKRSQVNSRSASLADPYPGAILLEAERRYACILGKTGVVSLSMFTGWHRSLQNQRYHYTLRGYNTVGWMVLTLEMQARNRGKAFTYGSSSWKAWASKAGGGNLSARYFFNVSDHKEQELSLIIGVGLLLTGPKSEMDTAPLMDGDQRRPQERSDPVIMTEIYST